MSRPPSYQALGWGYFRGFLLPIVRYLRLISVDMPSAALPTPVKGGESAICQTCPSSYLARSNRAAPCQLARFMPPPTLACNKERKSESSMLKFWTK